MLSRKIFHYEGGKFKCCVCNKYISKNNGKRHLLSGIHLRRYHLLYPIGSDNDIIIDSIIKAYERDENFFNMFNVQ